MFNIKNRQRLLKVSVVAVSLIAVSANAALPAWATSMLTDAATAGTDASAGVGPVIGAVLVAGIVIKLIKRFASKI